MNRDRRVRALLRMMLLLVSLAIVLAAQSPATAPGSCGVCQGKEVVACVSCAGSGLRPAPCTRCNQSKRRPCPACAAMPKGPRDTLAAGRSRCTSLNCRPGCKVCSGTKSLDCLYCVAGVVPCACEGRPLPLLCGDCDGFGHLPCPLCKTRPAGGRCAICDGVPSRACARCAAAKGKRAVCLACDGKGGVPCRTCRSTARVPCKTCFGGGTVRVVDLAKNREKIETCATCRGAGYARCADCREGKSTCDRCQAGGVVDACGQCDRGKVGCSGCRESPCAGLVTLAELLVDAERYGDAVRYYEAALTAGRAVIAAWEQELAAIREPDTEPADPLEAGDRRSTLAELQKRLAAQSARAALAVRIRGQTTAVRRVEAELAEVRQWLPPQR